MLLGFTVNRKRLMALGLVFFAFLAAAGIYLLFLLNKKTFYSGIIVGGVDISGLTLSQAGELVNRTLEEKYRGRYITLRYNGKTWKLMFDHIKYRFKVDKALQKAYETGRKGSPLQRLKEIANAAFNKLHIELEPDFDKKSLYTFLENIGKEIYREKKDASITYKNGIITFNREVTGTELDIDINVDLVENCIQEGKFDNINLIVKETKPRILYDDIKEINGELSSFYTVFNPENKDRSHNIRLACERINNTILLVGDIFSMDRALGPRTLENGYREAPVIYKNELVMGPGGGVCQVTTTLYVAVLKARLEVIERKHHSMPLGYVQPGQDATIVEGNIDFKFQNSLDYEGEDYPICISAEVVGNKIWIRILGKKTGDHYEVKLKSEIVEEYVEEEEDIIIDDSVPDGEKIVVQEARKGMKVIVYREVYSKNGELLSVEKISEDIYKPVKAQVMVNSRYMGGLGV